MIYKTGSRGEEVMRIQQALVSKGYKVSVDGVYGKKTATAVGAFQHANGLKPVDGIVGPVTMELLTGKAATDGLVILNGYITTHITYRQSRSLKYIAIHYTAGAGSKKGAAMATRKVFLIRNASADFVVDDEQVVQINPDIRNYYCWAVGDKKNAYSGGGRLYGVATNKNTINIEICSCLKGGTTSAVPNHAGWSFTDKALDNALLLVRRLMKDYKIPKENVVRHYDITGKACPGIPGWNDAVLYTTDGKQSAVRNTSEKWEKFLAAI